MTERRINDLYRTENWCVHRVRDWAFCAECHDAALRSEIAEAVRGLPDDCHSEEGSCYCGSDLNPDTSVSRAAVLAVVEGDR